MELHSKSLPRDGEVNPGSPGSMERSISEHCCEGTAVADDIFANWLEDPIPPDGIKADLITELMVVNTVSDPMGVGGGKGVEGAKRAYGILW